MYEILLYSYIAFWNAYFWLCILESISLSVRFWCACLLFLSPHFLPYCVFPNANLGNGASWNAYLCLCILVNISVNNPKHTTTNMSHCHLTLIGFAISLHGSARCIPAVVGIQQGHPAEELDMTPDDSPAAATAVAPQWRQRQCHHGQGASATILD